MERAAQTFPVLTPAQIDRISALGSHMRAPAGEVLFDAGEQNTRFFVVLSGGIEIVSGPAARGAYAMFGQHARRGVSREGVAASRVIVPRFS